MKEPPAIVVFSHLRWDWVYQRPQHLLSRLARDRRVIFIEEPLFREDGQEASWRCSRPELNVTACNAFTPVPDPGFNDYQMPTLRRLVRELIQSEGLTEYIVWLYTPMALPLLEELDPQAVVYDVMDELSAFRGAPPSLLERESQTYLVADVVFTGGPSLFRAKQQRHHNVHCFPSSVDQVHFGRARNDEEENEAQRGLPHPRLGFFGVIDERLDIPLLARMAEAHPEWQIIMVGPTIKIDPASLPRHENIHYRGQQPYASLPGFLAGWDVCLLPFARNEATRFISPTKTLEYMASGKPIVSTPITDVAEPYGDIVHLGDTPEAFIAACERALGEPEAERQARFGKMRQVLGRTSWDETAAAMSREISRVLAARESERGLLPEPAEHHEAVVIGAGPTGLSAAYHLGPDALLVEKNDRVGGWCRSVEQNGFTWDFAGHIMFTKDEYVEKMYKMLLGDNVHWQDREAWIYSKNVYTRYPFQGALYGLPANVIKECILGAIEARFGLLKKDKNASLVFEKPGEKSSRDTKANGHANGHTHVSHEPARCSTGDLKDCCADGILESTARLTGSSAQGNGNHHPSHSDNGNGNGNGFARSGEMVFGASPRHPREASGNGHAAGQHANFEEFIYKVWGAGIAKHFAIPYNRKLWAVPLTDMETSWLGGRVPLPDLEEMIEGALQPVPRPMGPNARFGYPLRGGFQAMMNGFLPFIQHQLRLCTGVTAISPGRRTVTLSDGKTVRYDYLISTMPLPQLIRAMAIEAPPRIREAARGLRHVSVRCVNIGVGRENITEKHWIYYPEDTVFHRIFVQGNASPHCNAPGGFCYTCEITYSPDKPLPCDGEDLIRLCIEDSIRVGFIRREDPVWAANQCDLPYAYVIYDHGRAEKVKLIREWLAARNIILAGRYSEWEYYNSDHAFLAGKKAAEAVRSLQARREGTTPDSIREAVAVV